MKIKIDVSVFTNDAAIGMVDGEIKLPVVPAIGSIICMSTPLNRVALVKEFDTHLKVENVLFSPGEAATVILMLEDIVAESREKALEIMTYLEKGFDLLATEFDETETE